MFDSPLILHIPHDSRFIPPSHRSDILLSDEELQREIIYMTDSHTDDLYKYEDAERVIFPVSRLVLDPERFADDNQEPMAERGMGVIYTITSHLQKLRNKPSPHVREELLNSYYHPHHEKLTQVTDRLLSRHDQCLLIDCHSYPSKTLPYEMKDGTEVRPEICIGADDFHTPQVLTDALQHYFQDKGYEVAVNTPFAGALTPLKHYGKDPKVMAIMYEIRRDLYMDELTGEKNANFSNVQTNITASIDVLRRALKSL